jgi:hypothetical protein
VSGVPSGAAARDRVGGTGREGLELMMWLVLLVGMLAAYWYGVFVGVRGARERCFAAGKQAAYAEMIQ